MIALVIDMCAQVRPVALSAGTLDGAIEEIDRKHRSILHQSGLTEELLRDCLLSDLGYIEWGWSANIFIDSYYGNYGDESDDQVVLVCMHDARRSHATHTGLFVGTCCETIVFEYDDVDESSLRNAAYDAILNDRNDLHEDLHTCFTASWVEHSRNTMPELVERMPGLRCCELRGNGAFEDWDLLKLFVFDNRPPPSSFC